MCGSPSKFRGVCSRARDPLIFIGNAPEQKRLFLWIAIGTIPAVVVGAFLKLGGYMDSFRFTDLVAVNLIIYGVLLGAADRWRKQVKNYEDLTARDAILVGLAQALALIPGTSRSGVAARRLRADASRSTG